MAKSLHLFCLSVLFWVTSAAMAAEPLTTFSAEDVIGNAWIRTLVTYPLSFLPGQAKPDRLKLVDANGAETVCQICA